MAASTPASGLALFLLAHHDDEVFCAGRLSRALTSGRGVRLMWATAGGLAPARRRVAEGVRVVEALGLPAGAATDLLLRDQHAVEHVEVIAREVVRQVDHAGAGARATGGGAHGGETDEDGSEGAPPHAGAGGAAAGGATVYVPAYEGGNPDHDAVNLAAALALRARPGLRVLEFPLYRRGAHGLDVQSPVASAKTPPEPFDVLTLTDQDLALRRALARANRSQLAVSLAPLLTLARWAGRGRAEPARPLPAHDYARPPHPGRLLYELYTPWRFAAWAVAAGRSRG